MLRWGKSPIKPCILSTLQIGLKFIPTNSIRWNAFHQKLHFVLTSWQVFLLCKRKLTSRLQATRGFLISPSFVKCREKAHLKLKSQLFALDKIMPLNPPHCHLQESGPYFFVIKNKYHGFLSCNLPNHFKDIGHGSFNRWPYRNVQFQTSTLQLRGNKHDH